MKRTSYFFKAFALILIVAGLSACSMLRRHPESGYSEYRDFYNIQRDYEQERMAYEESLAREEIGFGPTKVLNEQEAEQLNQRLQLKAMEQNLRTQKEKKQYYQYKSRMRTDKERMYFLSLPSIQARDRWAFQMGFTAEDGGFSGETAELIENNDISLGMTQKAVLESWGDPELVEVAGNPVYGNERWKYSKFISSESGYRREIRVVYFENGVVAGWESL